MWLPNRLKAVFKVWVPLLIVLWGKSQSAISPFCSTFCDRLGYISIPCPQYGLHLQDWNYMHMSVSVHTTCLLSLATSCQDADIFISDEYLWCLVSFIGFISLGRI